jgi:sugar lactone lactonase YvrE
MMVTATTPVVDGFAFPECPRWHDSALWFSDQHGGDVWRINPDNRAERVVHVPGGPSGLDWDSSGSMLVVSMQGKSLHRYDGSTFSEVADLSAYCTGPANDMVVTADDFAIVGNIGFDFNAGEEHRNTVLVSVDLRTGETAVVAEDVSAPNGMVITPDGATLILAESFGHVLTAFTLSEGGRLSDRRVFADLDGAVPDGICLDAQGCVWYASISTHDVVRVGSDGRVRERVSTGDREAVACMLGGADRRQLYVCTSTEFHPTDTMRTMQGRIEVAPVAVAGAGRP